MKKIILIILMVVIAAGMNAQTAPTTTPEQKPQKVQVTPYGFVRNYFNYDSRSMYTVCGGEYNTIPYDESWNLPNTIVDGEETMDINNVPQAHLLALTTRFGFKLAGPDVWGAKSTGRIEGDFAGFGNNNTVFRIRQAWVDLNWGHHAVRVGQDWHPLSGDIMPNVLGMAAGAPFRPHSRTPQIRYTFKTDMGFGVVMHALYQMQFQSVGPEGASAIYANRAIVPELFAGLNYRKDNVYVQLGLDVSTIRPRVSTTKSVVLTPGATPQDYNVAVDEQLTSMSPTIYFQYVAPRWSVKFRSTLAQNTAHCNMISGYGISAFNPDGTQEYTPLQSSVTYLDLSYGTKLRGDIFFGYMKNLGTTADLALNNAGAYTVWTKNNITNVNSIFRIAPSISYNLPHFNIGIEYELTSVEYGDKTKMKSNGTFAKEDVRTIDGQRICVLVKYNF